MSQYDLYEFLGLNLNKFFTTQMLIDEMGLTRSSITKSIKNLSAIKDIVVIRGGVHHASYKIKRVVL